MVKCKRCNNDRNYIWDKIYNESTGKWRLWDEESERPHTCEEKKTEYISPQSKHDKKLWKTSWNPEMDLPSKRICGVCKSDCVIVTDCPDCKKTTGNPCREWCPTCNTHSKIIHVIKK